MLRVTLSSALSGPRMCGVVVRNVICEVLSPGEDKGHFPHDALENQGSGPLMSLKEPGQKVVQALPPARGGA